MRIWLAGFCVSDSVERFEPRQVNGACRRRSRIFRRAGIGQPARTFRSFHSVDLEHVSDEMMTPMVPAGAWVFIVPFSVVDRNLHLGWIAIIEAIAASIVFVTPKILGIIDIWIMLEAAVIAIAGGSSPSLTISPRLLCLSLLRNGQAKTDSAQGT